MGDTKGFTIWLTGMSGSGKTTLAHYVSSRLQAAGRKVEVLDEEAAEDYLAQGLSSSRDDRDAYVHRLAWIAELLSRNGVVAVVAATSPYREVRDAVRRSIGEFVEVFCDCPVEALIERDVKGLYRKALAGEIPNFTGITEPYEPPLNPEVMLDSSCEAVEESARRIVETLLGLGYLERSAAKVALFGKGKAGVEEARRLARAAALKAARVTRTRAESGTAAGEAPTAGDPQPPAPEAEPRRATRTESGRKPSAGAARKATGTRTVSRPTRRAAKVASAESAAKKKAPAKKSQTQKSPAKKASAKKAPAKGAPAKKTPAKKAAKKTPAQKVPAKKAPAKKTPAKKTPAKKAPAKKTPAKKGPAKQGEAGRARATARGATAAAAKKGGKKAGKKAPNRKAPARKAPAKKGPAKQGSAGKARATAKKAARNA